jgi:hypothetical protein
VSTLNANLACRALELAEGSGGLRRMAALCVAIAAATTGTVLGARKALEIILHPDLLGAAQSLLAELAQEPAAEQPSAHDPAAKEPAAGEPAAEESAAEEPSAEGAAVMLAIGAN